MGPFWLNENSPERLKTKVSLKARYAPSLQQAAPPILGRYWSFRTKIKLLQEPASALLVSFEPMEKSMIVNSIGRFKAKTIF